MGKETRRHAGPWRTCGRFLLRNLPLVVGLGALAFSIYQGSLDRQTARFSVRPVVQLSYVALPASQLPAAGLFIANDGVGIAFIDDIAVTYASSGLDGSSRPLEVLAQDLRSRYPDFPPVVYATQVAQAIPPNTEKCLFGVSVADATPQNVEALRAFLSGLKVVVHYHSVYNESFETGSTLE